MAYNDVFRLRVYQRLHGAQVVNVMHFVQDDPTPGIGGAWLAADFITTMRPTLIARAVNQLLFEFVEVQSLVPFSGGPEVVNFPASTVGTVSGAAVSATLAEVVTIYSQRAGRRGRGRIYLAGADSSTSSNISVGIWQPNQNTRTVAMATALATRYIYTAPVARFHLGVWSRAAGPENPPWSTDQFARATGMSVRTIVRTQRRRQVGVGR